MQKEIKTNMETQLSNFAIPVAIQLGAIEDICLSVIVGVFLLLLAMLLVRLLRPGLHRIREGEVAVVERLGRFARLAGPGLVWVTPGVEQISHTVPIRLREEQFTIRNLRFGDVVQVDIEFTVYYWLDLHSVKPSLLRDVAYRSTEQWRRTIENNAARILLDAIPQYNAMELIGKDELYREEIERTLARRLEMVLREWGIRLKQPQGAWLRDIQMTEEFQKTLTDIRRTDIDSQTKIAALDRLRQQFPSLSDTHLLWLFINVIGGQEKELIPFLPFFTTDAAGREATREEVRSEASDREKEPSLAETKRSDSWRSLKPPPERDESAQGE